MMTFGDAIPGNRLKVKWTADAIGLPYTLADRDFLTGPSPTIADVSVVAYTRLAHEGGFDLAERPGIRKWIARCEGSLRIH